MGQIEHCADEAVVLDSIDKRTQKCRLAVPTGRRESRRLAAERESEESLQFVGSVDELVWRQRAVKDERVHGYSRLYRAVRYVCTGDGRTGSLVGPSPSARTSRADQAFSETVVTSVHQDPDRTLCASPL